VLQVRRAGALAPVPPRLGARPVARPHPASGIFETILVRDGIPVALDRHLARLRLSASALGLDPPGASLEDEVRALAAACSTCRVRVIAVGDRLQVESAPLPPSGESAWLRSVALPGGLGAHKWRDRRLVDALAAEVAPALALLVDLDGDVLETTRANVIVLTSDTKLVTPPADGRILPGVTRGRMVEALQIQERPIGLDELTAAQAIVLTGALRGVEAVTGVDAAALPPPPPWLAQALGSDATAPAGTGAGAP
jgi:para-aminobenzoate synthetase/4-amino-4-deoxychorismate lyase